MTEFPLLREWQKKARNVTDKCMTTQKQVENIFSWIVKIGLWVIPVLPIYVSKTMLFPYITGKNFTFRIIVEIIFAAWAGLAVMNPEYRPRLTRIFKAASFFVLIVFLADLFSPNPYRAFFSNYERMEGFMMLGHLYLYFVMLVSMFKTRRDWFVFFHVSLAASVVVSFYGLLEAIGVKQSIQGGFRPGSTIGNPTYLAAYLLYHVWLALILLYEFWRTWWARVAYGAALLFELLIIYFTATRGVTVALVAVSVPLAALAVLFWNRIFRSPEAGNGESLGWPAGRKIAAAGLVLLVAAPVAFWSLRNSQFVKSSQVLDRITNYSFSEGTTRARFMIWKMAAEGVAERPILGWGQENFYLVFQKHYNPGLYGDEPWFDRAHNIIFDWAINAGIPGILSYLALLGMAIWSLIRGMRKGIMPMWHGLILAALFTSAFLQNLFVFDNLNTYLLFFAFLAYADYLAYGTATEERTALAGAGDGGKRRNSSVLGAGIAASSGMLILACAAIYTIGIRPILEARAFIGALEVNAANGSANALIEKIKESLSYNSFGNTEVREQLASLSRGVFSSAKPTPEEKKAFLEFSIEELRKQVAVSAPDVKHVLFLGSLITQGVASRILTEQSYFEEADALFRKALDLAPAKQAVYMEAAQFYLVTDKIDSAAELLEKSWELDKSNKEASASLWAIAAYAKKQDIVDRLKKEVRLDAYDLDNVKRIATAYQKVALASQKAEDYRAVLPYYARVVALAPREAKYHAVYAALLAEAGNIEEARKQAEEAMRLDANFIPEGTQFLEGLKNK